MFLDNLPAQLVVMSVYTQRKGVGSEPDLGIKVAVFPGNYTVILTPKQQK